MDQEINHKDYEKYLLMCEDYNLPPMSWDSYSEMYSTVPNRDSRTEVENSLTTLQSHGIVIKALTVVTGVFINEFVDKSEHARLLALVKTIRQQGWETSFTEDDELLLTRSFP